MSTVTILRKGLSTLLNSSIIEILSDVPGVNKAVDLLRENFTFTAAEIAKNFQDSYGYALVAISSGLATPENQRGFWQSLFQANVESEFSQRLERDYLLPFAQQAGLAAENLSTFRQTAVVQYQQMATLTLFQADNVHFSEADLASFVTASGASSMTDLVLELVQTQQTLDERVMAFLQFKELLGNALLFFLYEQLRKEPRFQSTLAALQREGLMIEVREIKQIVQTTEAKLAQAYTARQFGEVAQLGQQLERLQQIDAVIPKNYAQFLDFSQRFADWAQLVNVQLKQVLATMPKLQERLVKIEDNTEQILDIVQQLKVRADLGQQIKPRDELTQPTSCVIQVDKRKWWNQLDDNWKKVFKEAISIKVEPSDSDLEKIVNLQRLDCCWNDISDLEPLRALKSLQLLYCYGNQISDLEPLRALKSLQILRCYGNQISDLEPLRALKSLRALFCHKNRISDSELDKFKKAMPNCKVDS